MPNIDLTVIAIMTIKYQVNVTFQGTATVEIEAASVEAARQEARTLPGTDLARAGQADILSFKVAAREITPAAALAGEHAGEPEESSTRKPRPSGWYRPL